MYIISFKSMTMAIRASKTLNENYIENEIIKLEPNMTKKGCAYGIKFNCIDINSVTNVFKQKRVKYTEIIIQ